MSRLRGAALTAAMVCFCAAGAARADVIYSTGFESPTFAPGNLSNNEGFLGQDNWVYLGDSDANASRYKIVTGSVGAGTTNGGTQALRVDAGAFAAEVFQPLQILDPVAEGWSHTVLSYDTKLSATTNPSARWGARFYDYFGNLLSFGLSFRSDGKIQVDNGFVLDILPQTVVRGQWINVKFDLNWDTGKWDAYLDNALVHSGSSFDNTQGLGDFDLYHARGTTNSTDFALYDNFSVTTTLSIPEPASIGLLMPALAAMGRRRR